MSPAFVVRFNPAGPWRFGPDSGERDRVESVLHSDALYSAVSSAMAQMGMLQEWIEASFSGAAAPAVRFSSCFPFQDDLLFVIPPSTHWPPPPSLKVRWKGARFVPLKVVESLLADEALDEDLWRVDGLSQCLVPAAWSHGPFRQAMRSNAAVDRLGGQVVAHRTACLEFSPGGGTWALVSFANDEAEARWSGPVRGALRVLADSGIGGERSRGWGRSRQPEFSNGAIPGVLQGSSAQAPPSPDGEPALTPAPVGHWLLSLFSPAAEDAVDWSRGRYSLLTRGGRVESPVAFGSLKKQSRMVAEGSVIASENPPRGAAHNVAPEGFPHPVYRAGFAVSVPIPSREVPR